MVQRMKAAGCIVIGKTNTPEFGLGSHTFNEVFGVTRNAYDPSRSAGGSSGGAAVALATRMLPVADGSDFMGSLRNPAGWNNVFGLRPSQGRVPAWPAPDVWVTQLGTEGPMGAHRATTSRGCSTCRPGHDPRLPLSLAAHAVVRRRAGWRRRARPSASAGSATWTATCRWRPASSTVCEQALASPAGVGCAVEPMRARLRARSASGRRGWSGGAGWSPAASRRSWSTRRTAR